jgi:sulfur dioxygenase
MIFRQLFEPLSSTYTYLVGCPATGQALLIDPVVNSIDRDLALLQQLGLTLALHAGHPHPRRPHHRRTAAARAHRQPHRAPRRWTACPAPTCGVEEGLPMQVGSLTLEPCTRPGTPTATTPTCVGERVFTGDALLIDGCGRTDFQNGSAADLYRSVTGKLFSLPDEHLVYPGHDYQGRRVSSIAQEKARNPRLGAGRAAGRVRADHGRPEPALPQVHRPRRARQPPMRRVPHRPAPAAAGVLRKDDGECAGVTDGSAPSAVGDRLAADRCRPLANSSCASPFVNQAPENSPLLEARVQEAAHSASRSATLRANRSKSPM